MKIIGVTGLCCSGKDTVARYIANVCKYVHYSLSDIIREVLEGDNIKPTRKNMSGVGIILRRKYGNSVLVKHVLNRIHNRVHDANPAKGYCISSIRHTDEVNELRHRSHFILINVIAPLEVRFLRMKHRSRLYDPKNILDFVHLENKENNKRSKSPIQQIIETAKLADIILFNNTTDITSLKIKIIRLLLLIGAVPKWQGKSLQNFYSPVQLRPAPFFLKKI